jgi:C-terminal processing protease CtpA/Prc
MIEGTARRLALVLALLTVAAPSLWAQTSSPAVTAPAATPVFDEAWRLVRDEFYDRKLGGLDWTAIGDNYRNEYAAASTDDARAAVIDRMLARLGASHTGYYTQADTAYYDLADIFSGGLRRQLPRHFSGGEVSYTGIGLITREIDGRLHVIGLLDGLPAVRAGLEVGDEILSADGQPFAPVESFAGKSGKTVTLTIRRNRDGAPQQIDVTPVRIEPNDAFLSAMRNSARLIERDGRKIGYIHVWSYARGAYQELLEEEISTGALKDADALIWDLRDGWGGASPDYLDIFNPRAPTMTVTDRDGDRSVVNARWHKPVALLVNGGTRSGKEVLTYGFKKYGYGEVIGTRTAGALLAGRAFLLSDGSLLLLAVSDVSVDGERLEGRGVEPTIEVPFDIPYAAGRDPQLDKAVEVLSQALGG